MSDIEKELLKLGDQSGKIGIFVIHKSEADLLGVPIGDRVDIGGGLVEVNFDW